MHTRIWRYWMYAREITKQLAHGSCRDSETLPRSLRSSLRCSLNPGPQQHRRWQLMLRRFLKMRHWKRSVKLQTVSELQLNSVAPLNTFLWITTRQIVPSASPVIRTQRPRFTMQPRLLLIHNQSSINQLSAINSCGKVLGQT